MSNLSIYKVLHSKKYCLFYFWVTTYFKENQISFGQYVL